jgi:NarL family two-component system response regulator LiaR
VPITVIIIEDDIFYNQSLRKIIEHTNEISCVAQCFTASEAVEKLKVLNPDVALLDINLGGSSGIDLLEHVATESIRTQFIMCTCFEDDHNVISALRKGASGYLVKGEGMDKIIASIKEVYHGGVPFSSSVARKVLQQFRPNDPNEKLAVLTRAEIEITQLLAGGKSYQQIADIKFISLDTVRKHITNIYRKLGVNNKVEALNRIRGIM